MKKLLAILLALLLALQMTAALAATYTDAETILAVQQALHDKGYYKGNLSGIKGNATEAAIRAYQQANGLNATGNIDDDLLAKLGLAQGSAGESGESNQAAAPAAAAQGDLSFTMMVNKQYSYDEFILLQNDVFNVSLYQVRLRDDGTMVINIRCERDTKRYPDIAGYAATGDLVSLKVGGVSAKESQYDTHGLGGTGGGSLLQYTFLNPEQKPVELTFELKSSRVFQQSFKYKVGPIHISFEGDFAKTAQASAHDATAALRGEPVTIVERDDLRVRLTGISQEASRYYDAYPSLVLTLSVSNNSDHDIYLEEKAVKVNGQEQYYVSLGVNGYTYDSLWARAGDQDIPYKLTIGAYDDPLPAPDELESIEWTLVGKRPEEGKPSEYGGMSYATGSWTELFIEGPIALSFGGGEPLPEPLALTLPAFGASGEWTEKQFELFSLAGVTVNVYATVLEDGGYRGSLRMFCEMSNENDADVQLFLEQLKAEAGDMTGLIRPDQSLILAANASESGAAILRLPMDTPAADVKQITGILRVYDTAAEKNIAYQPIVIDIEQAE